MTTVIEARGLGRRYRTRWALAECTLSIPAGHVVGLVGPNGAGKTTLLNLAAGLLTPTTGSVAVLGQAPGASPAQLSRVGFVAQDAPVYPTLSITDHLRLGARLNPGWDAGYAQHRIVQLGLNLRMRAGKLSGGQRAQLALTLALAKRPDLLVLDEPVASLDPLARREFLIHLADSVAERRTSVVLSSHLISDLARVCDYLIVLSAAHVQLAGTISELLAAHRSLTAPRATAVPTGYPVVATSDHDTQSTLVVRSCDPPSGPAWQVSEIGLEDLVLSYLTRGRTDAPEATR
jgi:ABC-2 type transport system ATP-binding protein